MLSRVASIAQDEGRCACAAAQAPVLADSDPAPPNKEKDYQMPELPGPWDVDGIDSDTLVTLQQQEFSTQCAEADADQDAASYIYLDQILHSISPPYQGAPPEPKVMLPAKFQHQVIERCHQELGHMGFYKTLQRVRESYVWPGMRQAIRSYVRDCEYCQTMTPASQDSVRGTTPTPPRPFHTWALDLVGPFEKSPKGNKYLLTCIDTLTGWAEAIPIPNKTNKCVWEAIQLHILARYGLPSVLLTDNGGEFTADAFRKWLAECGVKHKTTSPYHPRANGKCERFNGTLQKLLLKWSGGDPERWEDYLPDAIYSYRIAVNQDGMSPYQVAFGQRPRVPKGHVEPTPHGERFRKIKEGVKVIQEGQRKERPITKQDRNSLPESTSRVNLS